MRCLNWMAAGLAGWLMSGTAAAHEFQGELTLRAFGRVSSDTPLVNYAGTRMQLRYEHHTQGFSVYAEGRFRWNGVFMGDPPYSQAARDAYEFAFDLREAYVQVPWAGFDWSLGWQQVVWGKADQLRILDQINPLDLREFVLLDMKDYRKPIPMLRLNGMVRQWETELLYVPTFTPIDFAKPGSEYAFQLIPNVPGVRELPSASYDNVGERGQAGMRLSRSFEGLDLSLVGLYTRDSIPVLSQSLEADLLGPYVGLRKQYHRFFMAGTSFAAPVSGSTVLRGEFYYIPAKTFMLKDAGLSDGLERRGEVAAMLALDYTYGNWLFSVQALNRTIIDWAPRLSNAENTPTFTVSAQGNSFDGRLETRIFLAAMPVTGDGSWLQVKNTYSFDDHFSTAFVVDLMQGPKDGFFGRFSDRDRVGLELTYRF